MSKLGLGNLWTTYQAEPVEVYDEATMALRQLAEYAEQVKVDCDYCGAKAFTPCRNRYNRHVTIHPHFGTRREYKEWVAAGKTQPTDKGRLNRALDAIRVDRGRPA